MAGTILFRITVAGLLICCCGTGIADETEPSPFRPAQAGGRRGRLPIGQLLQGRLADSAKSLASLKRKTWQVDGVEREALVYVPDTKPASGRFPVVFAFHGHGGRAQYAARKLAIHEFWPEAICVYPLGLPTPVPLIDPEGKRNGWQKSMGDQQDRDLHFFDAMLKSLVADYSVDDARIYSTGHSNGGYFTYVLWAARGNKLAAVAPIAAGLDLKDFRLQKPKPVLHVAGEKDPIVKFRVQELTMAQDRKLNSCEAEGRAAGDWCTEYASSEGNSVVTFIHPGGHEIPEGAPKRIAQFFQEHPAKEAR